MPSESHYRESSVDADSHFLTSETEARLRETAAQQGQDINLVATELLTRILEWGSQDSEETIVGIQHGLDEFAAGQSRAFEEFSKGQLHKHSLTVD
jgi:hypothetical protein